MVHISGSISGPHQNRNKNRDFRGFLSPKFSERGSKFSQSCTLSDKVLRDHSLALSTRKFTNAVTTVEGGRMSISVSSLTGIDAHDICSHS